ncbi:hypothetical protein [Hymenobacter metallilatus]|uniref:Uncharacterized protein n=1 Tax=Hymenobacter metallilatus TaxID=2493666 RepID=A0A428IYN8_9BACT|nr:hypothetical protein [Hymenobacter metallilatus]RSK24080.1 hypothetical protein EI290_21010 [Hymenobacter metallilatus]
MKKLLLLVALLLGLLWLAGRLLPPALPTARHLATVPVVRKPDHLPLAHPKRVFAPTSTGGD